MITAKEWQLTSFFESNPVLPWKHGQWPYTEATFESEVEGYQIHCQLEPACHDIHLRISQSDFVMYEFTGSRLLDIRYHSKLGQPEVLELVLADEDTVSIQLRPRPSICHSREFFGIDY